MAKGIHALAVIGFTLVFAASGVALSFWLVVQCFKGTPDSLGVGMALGIFLLIGLAVGFVVGTSLGIWMAVRMLAHQHLRIPALVIACLGYIGLIYGAVLWKREALYEQEVIQKWEASRAESQAQLGREENKYRDAAARDWPTLFGSLIYPGANIQGVGGRLDRTYPSIVFSSGDPYQTVVNYYRNITTDVDEQSGFQGYATRPGDSKPVRIVVDNRNPKRTYVTITVSSERKPPPPNQSPSPSPSPAELLANDPSWVPVETKTEIVNAYGLLIYPGSRTHKELTESPRPEIPVAHILMATSESFETVRAFYRRISEAKVDKVDGYVGETTLQSDGLRVFVDVRVQNGLTFIGFSTG